MDRLHQFQDFMDNSSAGVLLQAVVVLLVGLIAIKILLRVTRRLLARTLIDSALYTFIVNTVKVVSLAILIVTVLSLLGIPTSTFVTVIAAVGAAVALAVQDSLSNFAGGLLIMISKPFVRGDLIESGGIMGMEPASVLVKMKKRLPGKFKLAEGPVEADGVIFTVDKTTGKTTAIERIRF